MILFSAVATAQQIKAWSTIANAGTLPANVPRSGYIFFRKSDTTLHVSNGMVWFRLTGTAVVSGVGSLLDAIHAAETDTATVLLTNGHYSLGVSETMDRRAALFVDRGAFISIGAGVVFTIQGDFHAGNYQVFDGLGTVKFDEGSVEYVNPCWFGAVGDSSTASRDGFQRALNSGVRRIKVKAPPGTYLITDSLRIPSNVDFIGDKVCIVSSDTNNYIMTTGPLVKNISISGFTLRYNAKPLARKPNVSAFYLNEVDTLDVSHNNILFAPGMGIEMIACKVVKVQFNHVENTLADGIHITNGTNADSGRSIWSENFIITNNTVVNTGDDHIACVSYQRPLNPTDPSYVAWTGSQEINRNGVISNNIVRGANTKYRTRGITVLGGRDIVVANNVIEGHPAVGDTNQTLVISGILIQGATSPFKFHRPARIRVVGNIIKKTTAIHFGSQFEAENGGIKIQGADSVEVVGNTIDWSPFMYGIILRGDNQISAYGYNSTPKDIRIIDNTINNARTGIRMFSTDTTGKATGWINRVTIRGNKFSNILRGAINADSVKSLFIEDNEFFQVNTAAIANTDAIRINKFGGDVSMKNNKFSSDSTVARIINATNPVTSGAHTAYLYVEGNAMNKITATSSDMVIPRTIASEGLKEYGAVDLLADTLSVGTNYVTIDTAQNRPRSTTTVFWDSDSSETLQITNAAHFRVAGQLIAASADSNVTLIVGVSQNNAAITDDALTVREYLGDSDQFHTVAFDFFMNLAALTSIKLKMKSVAGTHNIYIRRGWLTVERLD